jgi:hypothetical protein
MKNDFSQIIEIIELNRNYDLQPNHKHQYPFRLVATIAIGAEEAENMLKQEEHWHHPHCGHHAILHYHHHQKQVIPHLGFLVEDSLMECFAFSSTTPRGGSSGENTSAIVVS